MNAGMVLWDAEVELGGSEEGFKVALSKLESGIKQSEYNVASALDEYVNRIKGTVFVQRGIAFLRTLQKERKVNMVVIQVFYMNLSDSMAKR